MLLKPDTGKENIPTNNLQWGIAALFNEYMSAVNPLMPKITIETFDSSLHETGKGGMDDGFGICNSPGLWHSHHNESEEDAYVLPIQDAGLVTQMRILDIQFATAN